MQLSLDPFADAVQEPPNLKDGNPRVDHRGFEPVSRPDAPAALRFGRAAGIGESDRMSPKLEQARELIREDRPEAIDRALALLQNTVYSFSMKFCGHPEDAEDTMQEVLPKLLPYLLKFENPQALSVWLYKVARNRCMMNRRGQKNSRGKHVSLDELMPSQFELRELIEEGPESRDQRAARRVRPKGARGGAENRSAVPMVVVLHDMKGVSTAEVVRVTGLREGTVRVVARIEAAAEEQPKRSRHCRKIAEPKGSRKSDVV